MPDLAERLKKVTQPVPSALFESLVTANHILHHNGVVDAYGHVSVRNPSNPATFFLSASVAPALVSSRADIVEYRVSDAEPLDKDGPSGYLERYIHSGIYKRWEGVQSVVHAHAEAVIPFGVSSVPLRSVYHMGGVMGPQPPVWDIASHYSSSDQRQDLLVSSLALGAALANSFAPASLLSKTTSVLKSFLPTSSSDETAPPFPPAPLVLMRGHGFTAVGTSIEEAVYRSVYTCANARVATTSLLLQSGFNVGLLGEKMGKLGGAKEGENVGSAAKKPELESVKFLNEREAKGAWEANATQASRPWALWTREVKRSGLYDNEFYGEEKEE